MSACKNSSNWHTDRDMQITLGGEQYLMKLSKFILVTEFGEDIFGVLDK